MINQITPYQLLTLSADNTAENIDLSSFIPVGATGVEIVITNTSFDNLVVGACHPSDTIRPTIIKNNTQTIARVGVNASRQVRLQVQTRASATIHLISYFDSDVVFQSNSILLPTVASQWEPIDLSAYSSTAKFAIIHAVSVNGDPQQVGLRHGDSTDTATYESCPNVWAIVPLNAAFICDIFESTTDFYLVAMINAGASQTGVDGTDISTSTINQWVSTPPISGNPDYRIVNYRGTNTADASGNQARLSESNSGTNELGRRPFSNWSHIVKTDSNGNIYQNIASTDYNYIEIGNTLTASSFNPSWAINANG